MKRIAALVVLVLLFTGCTASRTVGPAEDPGMARERMVDLAIQEWRAFEGQTVRFEGERERIDPVGLWEDSRAGSALVAKYWRAVARPWTGADCDKPWSAAFVTWVMRQAGVPERSFPGGALHADYLRAIAGQSSAIDKRFRLRDPASYAPRPGDLICAPRSRPRPAAFDHIAPEAPMHCDIVIANENGLLDSIGGNVRNSVSRTLRPVDASGLVTGATDRPWQLVVENLYP